MSINNWTGVGRITKDIDLRYSKNGKAIANFTVAINRPFKSANGEYEADFVNIVQFGKGAENTANYMKKGNQIGLTGRINTRNYENSEGKRVYVTEVVADNVQFLESKNRDSNTDNRDNQQGSNPFSRQNNPPKSEVAEPIDISSSDLPF